VWTVPICASPLAPHLHVPNMNLNALIVHMYPLNPLIIYRNLDLKWILNVQTHRVEPAKGQKYMHVAHVEHARDFPQIEHCTQ
jgi:hypothetical protein